MDTLRFNRATYRLLERGVEALEVIGRELERYNDRHERELAGDQTDAEASDRARDDS